MSVSQDSIGLRSVTRRSYGPTRGSAAADHPAAMRTVGE